MQYKEQQRDKISYNVWRQWICHPTQRDYKRRAAEPKFNERMQNYHPDHHEFKGVKCACDIVNPVTGEVYKKGTEIKCDGHTTTEYYDTHRTDLRPEHVYVTWHEVSTWDEIVKAYEVFDNSDAAEKANDRLDGAVRAVMHPKNLHITNLLVRSVTAVEYAASTCYPDKYTRGGGQSVRECTLRLADVYPGLVWVQDVVSSNEYGDVNKLGAPMLACYVSAYLKYKMQNDDEAIEKLKEFILYVSQDSRETRGKTALDCATFFMREYFKEKEKITNFSKSLNMGDASKRCQGFILRMIDGYVKGEARQKMCSSSDLLSYFQTWQNEFAGLSTIISQNVIALGAS